MAGRGNYKTVDYYQQRSKGVKDGFEAFSDEGMYYFTCNKNGEVFIMHAICSKKFHACYSISF